MKLSKKLADLILSTCLKTGGDYAEIYYQDDQVSTYSRRYKKVYAYSKKHINGVGIRILKGNKSVYGYTSDLSTKSLLSLAESLSMGYQGEKEIDVPPLSVKKYKNINPIAIPHDQMTTEEKFAYLKEAEDVAFSYSDKICDVMASLFEEDEHVEIYNSTGDIYKDDRVRTRLALLCIASDKTQFQSAFDGPGASKGLELLKETDFKDVALKCAERACQLLSAIDGPSGEMPVIIGNGFGGVLFHEACGHPLEGTSIAHKTSPFFDKYGKKVASDVVSAVDDGTIQSAWGSENIDDEGVKPTKNILIKDGVLVNFMVDRYNSRRIPNSVATGSCRRQSYKYLPTTRMTNTYIDNGKSTKEEIISSVKKGIYLSGFTGGQVDPSTDKFVFTSDVGYMVEDGKITKMIKPVTLMGYGYDILMKISMVANDLRIAPGVCGAASGSCFVSVGQPTLLVSQILVGGKGE